MASNQKSKLGRVVARRVLTEATNIDSKVVIYLGAPRRRRHSWECPFQIKGLGKSEIRTVQGADPLQALLLAIRDIKDGVDKSEIELVWMDRASGADIPMQVPLSIRAFERHLLPIVRREAEVFWDNYVKSGQAQNDKREDGIRWEKQFRTSKRKKLARVDRHLRRANNGAPAKPNR